MRRGAGPGGGCTITIVTNFQAKSQATADRVGQPLPRTVAKLRRTRALMRGHFLGMFA
jgi:hypothetical protein